MESEFSFSMLEQNHGVRAHIHSCEIKDAVTTPYEHAIGLDSLDFIRLLVRVETEFGLELESAEWEELKFSTVEQLSEYMADRILRTVNL
ncbi:acyl carrier protein [Paenibacillus wynnii]|uniref:acyl carrier protein n=1 Tax=Paenibacillus wynnii TaxID=268407 RepID=UPI002790C746|nr:phosphopantetheine-binding protein [Paenibacillus wynnii]MDQ0194887.1 acyl carrier protein [Paenibacillus wynnii]